ncbi:MAG: DHH family phosphoesterase [Candidatus Aenigmarchaeota archaeon]|nr:DHH family phosphoesterase [Candidatus Aenigmarchaeota archaeon]
MFADAVSFLKKIKPSDNVVIVFNNDGDGICACTLLKKMLHARACKEPYIIEQPMPTEKELLRKIQTTIPQKIIFLDLAMDQQMDIIKKIKSIADIMVVDHHKVEQNLNKKGMVHVNPRFAKPEIYQSATYLMYKICSQIVELSSALWIAGVGMIADYNLDDSQDIVAEIQKKYHVTDIKKTKLAVIAEMIEAARSTQEMTCEEMVKMFEQIESFEAFDRAPKVDKLLKAREIITAEMQRIDGEFKDRAEKFGNIILFQPQSKYGILSSVATKYGLLNPKKTVVIYEKKKSVYKISARNQDGKDVAELLKNASQDLKASAGGHKAAAGATISARDWDMFRERLIKLSTEL